MLIPKQHLDRLATAGLLISEPFGADHIGFPDGVAIGKPESVGGNSVPGWECHWGDDPNTIIIDAPEAWFHWQAGKWIVTVHACIPGPGPGDFVHEFDTAEEGVSDIIDYYFGDPARMDELRRAFAI